MPVPVWVPGQILAANDINQWMVPNAVIKAADQSVTSSTTLVNDTALVLPVLANASYIWSCFLDYEGGAASSSDLIWEWAVPAGAVMRYCATFINNSGNLAQGVEINTATTIAQSNGAGNLRAVIMQGSLVMSTTAGSMQLQWAQHVSSATATIVHYQSNLTMQRTN